MIMKLLLEGLDTDDVDLMLRGLLCGMLVKESEATQAIAAEADPRRRGLMEAQMRSVRYRTMKLQGAIVNAVTVATANEAIESLNGTDGQKPSNQEGL